MPHRTSTNKDWCKLTGDRIAGYERSEEKATQPPTQGLCYCRVQSANNFSVSLFTFVKWDRSQLVGLSISLRCIFKPSYSGNITNPNVGVAGQKFQLTGETLLTKISHADK